MINFINSVNQRLDWLTSNNISQIIIKIFFILFFISIISELLQFVYKELKKFIKCCVNSFFCVKNEALFKENDISLDITKKICESSPLMEKEDFLFENKTFLKRLVKSGGLFSHDYISLLKSSLIFIRPKILSGLLNGTVVANNLSQCSCKNINITVLSFIIIPKKLTYAKITLENLSNEEVQFNIANVKMKDIMKLRLYDGDSEAYQNVSMESCTNSSFIQKGTLSPMAKINLEVFFKTVDRSNLRHVKKVAIYGNLKFKRNQKYTDFLLTLSGVASSKEDVCKCIDSMFNESELFSLFKYGGITALSMAIIIFLFFLSIVINSLRLKIIFFILSIISFALSISINAIIIQYIYDRRNN